MTDKIRVPIILTLGSVGCPMLKFGDKYLGEIQPYPNEEDPKGLPNLLVSMFVGEIERAFDEEDAHAIIDAIEKNCKIVKITTQSEAVPTIPYGRFYEKRLGTTDMEAAKKFIREELGIHFEDETSKPKEDKGFRNTIPRKF